MDQLYFFGGELLTMQELARGAARGELKPLNAPMLGRDMPASARLAGRAMDLGALKRFRAAAAAAEPTLLQDSLIAIGKPLTIEVKHAYVGRHADRDFWNLAGDRDALLSSAYKSPFEAKAAPRAINFMINDPKPRSSMSRVAATDVGTPLIFASPAMADESLTITVEMMFDTFPKAVFDSVSSILDAAGKLPIFATASMYLVAGATVVRLLGELGELIFDGKPSLKGTLSLDLADLAGEEGLILPYGLLVNESFRNDVRRGYTLDATGRLVSKGDGAPYEGEEPYVSVRFANRDRPELRTFAPTLLSADLLSRFYNVRDGRPVPAELLIQGMKVYNDMVNRNRADEVAGQLEGVDASSDEGRRLKALYDALVKNIQDERMRPRAA